ncbi:hypothetical protein Sjap_011113 [Stephania japonica]|uniref:Uncharacterized protein n=1 Tax=Stephania japonica TaxID=461633 RepID=A0AAP0JAN4_9MAGN
MLDSNSTSYVTETPYLSSRVNRSFEKPDQPAEEKHQLLQFSFQELKSATGNFRPDSILGGGFGYVFM